MGAPRPQAITFAGEVGWAGRETDYAEKVLNGAGIDRLQRRHFDSQQRVRRPERHGGGGSGVWCQCGCARDVASDGEVVVKGAAPRNGGSGAWPSLKDEAAVCGVCVTGRIGEVLCISAPGRQMSEKAPKTVRDRLKPQCRRMIFSAGPHCARVTAESRVEGSGRRQLWESGFSQTGVVQQTVLSERASRHVRSPGRTWLYIIKPKQGVTALPHARASSDEPATQHIPHAATRIRRSTKSPVARRIRSAETQPAPLTKPYDSRSHIADGRRPHDLRGVLHRGAGP